MAKCKKCDHDLDPDTKVCPECGTQVPKGFDARQWILLAIIIYVVIELLVGRTVGVEPESEPAVEVVK